MFVVWINNVIINLYLTRIIIIISTRLHINTYTSIKVFNRSLRLVHDQFTTVLIVGV